MKRITLLLVVSHVALTTVAAIPERSFSMIREGKGYLQKGTPAEWVELDGEKVLKLGGGATARFREHEQMTMSDYRARLKG